MEPKTDEPLLPDGIDLELLQDLERQNLDQIRTLRKYDRFEIQAPVQLRPANASAPDDRVMGETRDLSVGGCLAQFPRPVGVGDIYRLQVQTDSIGVPQVYARCLRCNQVREDVFEAAFSFFDSISFEQKSATGSPDLLG